MRSPYRVFDAHHHVGFNDFSKGRAELERELDNEYQMRLPMMDRHGIGSAALHPPANYYRTRGHQDTMAMNDFMARFRQKYSERFPVVLGTVEPWHGEKQGVEEIERCVRELKLDGFSWHHMHTSSSIDSPFMMAFMKKIRELKVPAWVHVTEGSGEEDPFGVEVLAEKFPEVTIIVLDSLCSTLRAKRMIRIAKHFKNVYLEIGVTRSILRLIDMAVNELGAERIMFGSDLIVKGKLLHYNFPHPLYEVIDSPNITEEQKKMVLWGTTERLFGLK